MRFLCLCRRGRNRREPGATMHYNTHTCTSIQNTHTHTFCNSHTLGVRPSRSAKKRHSCGLDEDLVLPDWYEAALGYDEVTITIPSGWRAPTRPTEVQPPMGACVAPLSDNSARQYPYAHIAGPCRCAFSPAVPQLRY